MTPERESEYNELLGYVGLFATAIWQIDPTSETHPVNVMKRVVQQFGKSKALVGLRQAANDTVEETSHWNLEAKAVVDETCRAAGVVTLSEITRRYSAIYKRIMKRGFIKNETEYDVVNGILVDQGSAISDDERTCLQRLTESFEKKA
jgi:CBS-domain-containing membrane protein